MNLSYPNEFAQISSARRAEEPENVTAQNENQVDME